MRVLLLIAILIFTTFGCGSIEKTPEQLAANEAALNAVKAEEKVLDAVITEANFLYASVVDDGTLRDGFADYLCLLVADYPSNTVVWVKVVKAFSQKDPNRDNAYGVLLGESVCE